MKDIVFIHVPRTAGTSMNEWAKENAPSYKDLTGTLHPKLDPSTVWVTTQHTSIDFFYDRGVFSRRWFDDRFKIAFVRNPWDRLVSLYEHLKGYRLKQRRNRESNAYLGSFREFVLAIRDKGFVKPLGKQCVKDWSQANQQIEWLRWGINFLGKFEFLDSHWRSCCKAMGVEHIPLPHVKKSARGIKPYHDYYDDELVDIVSRLYRDDIHLFGYTYD